ncbi:MAG: hypothetical protein ACW9W4_01235 [Candidatus Nitrosopumilus sp. bin_7KS]
MLEYVFIQIPEDPNFSLIAIVVAIISSFAVTGSFLLNWNQNKKQTHQQYTELLIDFTKDIEYLGKQYINSKNEESFWDAYSEYLNKLEQIAHLALSKRIPNDIAKFFSEDFQDAYYSMLWFDDEKNSKDNPIKNHFGYVKDWYRQNEHDLVENDHINDVKSQFEEKKWTPDVVISYNDLLENNESEND